MKHKAASHSAVRGMLNRAVPCEHKKKKKSL